jgi:hypothetical protein
LPLTVNPSQLNPTDTSLNLQAAIKNLATNAVFYFIVPIELEAIVVPSSPIDIQSFVNTWKSYDDSLEVSGLVNGKSIIRCTIV